MGTMRSRGRSIHERATGAGEHDLAASGRETRGLHVEEAVLHLEEWPSARAIRVRDPKRVHLTTDQVYEHEGLAVRRDGWISTVSKELFAFSALYIEPLDAVVVH